MPAIVPEKELQTVEKAIKSRAEGASLGELLEILDLKKRTLQRRLDRLVTEGRILPQGGGRSRRYVSPAPKHRKDIAYSLEKGWRDRDVRMRESREDGETVPGWLSASALEIRRLVTRPMGEREQVGYDREFLQSYIPNETSYLSAELCEDLAELGKVGVSELPAGTYIRNVMDRLLIDLSWNSSRLEGNTYSLLETQRLLEIGEGVEGKSLVESQMILNHKAAIEMLADEGGELAFDAYTICNLHALLADGLVSSPIMRGSVREGAVGISGSAFQPLNVPQQLRECFDEVLEKAEAIRDPFEQAFFALVHFPYLQAFEDVNKRLSRLACNIPLVKWNLCPLSFVKVPKEEYVAALLGVYELNRVEYLRDVFVWAYRRSCDQYGQVRAVLGEPDPFGVRYRDDVKRYVREVVIGGMDKVEAAGWIARQAQLAIPAEDRGRFAELVEDELTCLHIGNIACHRLRPAEFEGWRAGWR